MQGAWRLPSPIPDTSHLHIRVFGGQQRDGLAVAGDDVPGAIGSDNPHLYAFDRGIHVPGGASRGGLLSEYPPRFDGAAQFDLDAIEHRGTDAWEPELGERIEPAGFEGDVMRTQIGCYLRDVMNNEVRQQVAAVQVRAMPDQRCAQRLCPEPGHQRAHQQRLHHRHLKMRRHLEPAQLKQAQAPTSAVRIVELVDTELRAVGISGDIGEQMPQRPIDMPRGFRIGQPFNLGEGNLQLVQRLFASLVYAGSLRCGADEPSGEQV